MKHIRHHAWSFITYPLAKLVSRRFLVVLIGLLSLLVVSTAYAGASWHSYSGPQWVNSTYQFTVSADLTGNEKYIDINYSVNGGAYTCIDCTGGPATWICTIPRNDNSTIAWDISAFPNSKCKGSQTPGWTGSFTTNPTALEITSFTTENAKTSILSSSSLLLIAFAGVALLLTLFWRYKTSKAG